MKEDQLSVTEDPHTMEGTGDLRKGERSMRAEEEMRGDQQLPSTDMKEEQSPSSPGEDLPSMKPDHLLTAMVQG